MRALGVLALVWLAVTVGLYLWFGPRAATVRAAMIHAVWLTSVLALAWVGIGFQQ